MSNAALTFAPRATYNTNLASRATRRILARAGRNKCVCGKCSYRTERKARLALEAIRRVHQSRLDALGQTGTFERSYYTCRHTGLYHLTSQE